jgi:hypothetical protein
MSLSSTLRIALVVLAAILSDTEFCSDVEIYIERLPACQNIGLYERNRRDEWKKQLYPENTTSELCVNKDILRGRCNAMVNEFCSRKGVLDATLKQRATDEFYNIIMWKRYYIDVPRVIIHIRVLRQ